MSTTHILPEQSDLQIAETSLTFEEAELRVIQARETFAETKRKFGPRVALADFNARVLRWAKEFTNPRLARVMYVVGTAMSGETHSYAITVNGWIGSGEKGIRDKMVKGSLLSRYHQAYAEVGKTISYPQFYRYLAMAQRAGIIDRIAAGERQGESEPHPGAWRPTTTVVNFWLVLKGDQVVLHDFGAELDNPPELPDEPVEPENDTGRDTRRDTQHDTGRDTETYSPTESYVPSAPTGKQGRNERSSEGTKEGRRSRPEEPGDSYWLGISQRYPDGYFIRVDGNTEPKGRHVRVDLTRQEVMNLFCKGDDGKLAYGYEYVLNAMFSFALDQNPGVDWLADLFE